MKIPKAIEILTHMGHPDFEAHTEDILAARKLGIEALRVVNRYSFTQRRFEGKTLLGETQD